MSKDQFEADLAVFIDCLELLITVKNHQLGRPVGTSEIETLDIAKRSCIEAMARVILPFDVKLADPLAKSHKQK